MTTAALEQPATTTGAEKLFRGWIAAPRDAAEHLTSLGIKLGRYVESKGDFEDCEASEEALLRLDPYFNNPYVWFFEIVMEQTLTVSITGMTLSRIEEALVRLSKHIRQTPQGDWPFLDQSLVDMKWSLTRAGEGTGEEAVERS
jgi:hypothetical protein